MVSSIKNLKLSENQSGLLFHVEPWWNENLTKLIKKQKRWLKRFGQQADTFFPQINYSYDEYSQLIKSFNHFLKFYNGKTKEILNLPRAVSKFKRWYIQVENLRALLIGIISLSEFYEAMEHDVISDKRQFLIQKTNDYLLEIYEDYKRTIYQISSLETHETLEQIFKNTPQIKDQEIFNPVVVYNLVHKYATRLTKIQKINEQMFVNIIFQTVCVAIFFEAYIKFQKRLLKNVI